MAGRMRVKGRCCIPEERVNSRRICITQFLREDLDHFLNRARQHVNFFFRVVESKRRARGGRNIESLHHRLRAVMTGANGNAFLIQNRADVVRMNVVDHKRQHARLFSRRADDPHAFDR